MGDELGGVSARWLAEATGSRLVGDADARATRCEVDSRKAGPDCFIVALKGERVDGHDFVAEAVRSGARIVIVDREGYAARESLFAPLAGKAAFVIANDALAALQEAARAYRLSFPGLIRFGVTGSSGKTTTKEILASILGRSRRVIMNPGNLNSEIGLPQSIFLMRKEHEIGVFEMGINHSGEMDALVRVFAPTSALILNVGTAHIGILGSREAIALEKKKIFDTLGPDGRAYVWEDDEFAPTLIEKVRNRVSTFGKRTTAGLEYADERGLDGWTIGYRGCVARFPLPGRHNLLDATAAISAAAGLGAGPEDVVAGLEAIRPLFGRSEIFRGETTVVRDCYNANPESVALAMEFCDSVAWNGRRVYVLGDMLELGAESENAHRVLGAVAAKSKADALFFFGEAVGAAVEETERAGFAGMRFQTTELDILAKELRSFVKPGDLVLLKASRGMALERLCPLFGMGE